MSYEHHIHLSDMETQREDDKYAKMRSQRGQSRPVRRATVILVIVVLVGMAWFLRRQSSADGTGVVIPPSIKQMEDGPQNDISDIEHPDEVWVARQKEVVEAFRHAFMGYEKYAWGKDHLMPLSHRGGTWMDVGMTVIDTLTTAYLMGQMDIFDKCLAWVKDDLRFYFNAESNVFELTIRILGGLLSAYHMSGSKHESLVERAQELGDILLKAFDTPTGLPLSSVNFATSQAVGANGGSGPASLAEIGTLQLEFKYLSYVTGDAKYWNVVQEAMRALGQVANIDGLISTYVDTTRGTPASRDITMGGRADSYYEYLAKQWLMTNETYYHDAYRKTVVGIRKHLLGVSFPNLRFFVGELPNGVLPLKEGHTFRPVYPKMDHLVCFLPGTLALAATGGRRVSSMEELEPIDQLDLDLAEELLEGCWEMYVGNPLGLAPEIVYWNVNNQTEVPVGWNDVQPPIMVRESFEDGAEWQQRIYEKYVMHKTMYPPPPEVAVRLPKVERPDAGNVSDYMIRPMDAHNILRPETVESLYVLHAITGNPLYRERGYEMFKAIQKYSIVPSGGYASIDAVTNPVPQQNDKMESFFISETLKYIYLLLGGGNESIDLTKVVFNTEAHPLPKLSLEALEKRLGVSSERDGMIFFGEKRST
ncbi:glycoside hydrolase [Gaertneriomyces semiglobifer]|nr:glycoside hydrolase [Gaertneriomyces semiglobifer]